MPAPANGPRAELLVVSYGAPEALEPLLSSVSLQDPKPRVRIWHNGPGPIELLGALRDRAEILGGSKNLGFGEGINRLLETSHADVCVIANPDLVLEPRCVGALCEALGRGGAVVAGGALASVDAPPRVNAYRQKLTLDLVGINTDRGLSLEALEATGAIDDGYLGPSGALFAVDRARYAREIGGPLFCAPLFLYLEDVALWIRLRRHGARIVFEPRARAVHAFSQSTGQRSARKLYYVERNRLWLARVLLGTPRAVALLGFTAMRYAAYLAAAAPDRPQGEFGGPATFRAYARAMRAALLEGLFARIPRELVDYLRAGRPTALRRFRAPLLAQLRNPVQ